MNVFKQRV